jgi:pyruvate kinase
MGESCIISKTFRGKICKKNFFVYTYHMNKTKIIATITDQYDEEKLIAIAEAGVNVIRLNFSHAKQETTKPLVDLIHRLNREGKTNLGILLDTKGPEIRTGERQTPYYYKKGETFRIFVNSAKMTEESDLFSDYEYLLLDVKVGNVIAIDSGLMTVEVKAVHDDYLLVVSYSDCEIGSRRHMNFSGVSLRLPGLTEKDKSDLRF